jgi:hypothetical protein
MEGMRDGVMGLAEMRLGGLTGETEEEPVMADGAANAAAQTRNRPAVKK